MAKTNCDGARAAMIRATAERYLNNENVPLSFVNEAFRYGVLDVAAVGREMKMQPQHVRKITGGSLNKRDLRRVVQMIVAAP